MVTEMHGVGTENYGEEKKESKKISVNLFELTLCKDCACQRGRWLEQGEKGIRALSEGIRKKLCESQ